MKTEPATKPTLFHRAAVAFVALLGCAFVAIGILLIMTQRANPVEVQFIRLFGIRDAFLGAYTLLLLIRGETRALFLLLASALVLPIADTLALAGPVGWARAAASNLPYELPLLIAVGLVARLKGSRQEG